MNANTEIQAKLNHAGLPPVAVRVGLASGEACVGNMGSATRFDYSVIGETVNTAGVEQRSTLSKDGKRLYFGRDGDIFMSTRSGKH